MPHNGKTVLLVDDNATQLFIMNKAFVKEGYRCLKATSAIDALELLKTELPDAILSDFEMPVMDGFDFKRRLMEQPGLCNIPFLFLTSYSDEEVMMKGLDLKAIDYMVKGTPMPVIISKLNNLLQTVQQQHELSIEELRKTAQALNIKSIPDKLPVVKGFTIDFWHKPFENYPGGDFIDFIQVNERYTCILLGDIMGKKWKAWFFTFCYLSYIRSAVRFCVYDQEFSPARILKKINMLVSLDGALQDILSSLSLVMIDMEQGTVAYAGAGDLPVVQYTQATGIVSQLVSPGLLLGLMPDGMYDEAIINMEPGDQLLLFTDGIIDYTKNDRQTTDYGLFVKTISPLMGSVSSFVSLKSKISFLNNGNIQADDASIIFIHKQ